MSETHIRRYVVGSVRDIFTWRAEHAELPYVSVPLSQPESLRGRIINPWDEVVYCESYYAAPVDVRAEIVEGLIIARSKGRQL